jgi:hypothetical protein
MFNPLKIIARDIRSRIPICVHENAFEIGALAIQHEKEGETHRVRVSVGRPFARPIVSVRASSDSIFVDVERPGSVVGVTYPYADRFAVCDATGFDHMPTEFSLFSAPKTWRLGSLLFLYRSGAEEDAGLAKYRATRAAQQDAEQNAPPS